MNNLTRAVLLLLVIGVELQTSADSISSLEKSSTREILLEKPYLNLPVKNGAPRKRVTLLVGGRELDAFDIELADGEPDWWAFFDATPFHGKVITVRMNNLEDGSNGLGAIDQTTKLKNADNLYRESLRPQFHFTSRRAWINDPNGLVYFHGEYHLFYQHNPYGWNSGNLHWGHAVSKDLIHWKELPVALYPDQHGMMYSGSAFVDWKNTGGFQTGSEPALVAMFTAAGHPFTQGIAFSNDRGRTWTKYKDNPGLGHVLAENRDPKVTWYAPENKWVMALYLDHNDFALFGSTNLRQWGKLSDLKLPGDAECPNFFPLSLDGNTNNQRWVFFGASGIYSVGKFDGREFKSETEPRPLHNGNCWYASQIYSDIPARDGRCILVPWGRLPDGEIFRGMSFNQMLGLPVELTLHATGSNDATIRINPIRELTGLRKKTHTIIAQTLDVDSNPLEGITGDLFEIEAVLKVGSAKEITLDLRGIQVRYDAVNQKLSCLDRQSALPLRDGKFALHIFLDCCAVDIFGDDGRLYMPMAMKMSLEDKALKISAKGGAAEILSLKVHELKSGW